MKRLRRVQYLCLLLFVFLSAGSASAANAPGMATMSVAQTEGARELSLTVWYPARGGTAESLAGNAVFLGPEGVPGGEAAAGPFPLVLLSHGGLRSSPDSGAWLAAGLARSGHVVVEVNAPRVKSPRAGAEEIWRRPQDLARALAAVLGDPEWAPRIDRTRISAVGFALGGTAALAVGGWQFDVNAVRRACAEGAGPDCAWFAAGGVALETLDPAPLERSYRLPEVSAVVAIAPEYAEAVSSAGEGSPVPSLTIALGATGVEEARLAPLVGDDGTNRLVALAEAGPFDAFPLCTPAGARILSQDGGDPALCGTSAQARGDSHNAMIELIGAYLEKAAK
jgi:predicted dienelactone hydrolase